MSHLLNHLGHRLANTTLTAVPYIVTTVFAIFLAANIPTYASGTLISGLSLSYWFGTVAIGILCVLASLALQSGTTGQETHHDDD